MASSVRSSHAHASSKKPPISLNSPVDPRSSDQGRLTLCRFATLVALSLVVWFLVALFIRFRGPAGVFDGWRGVATYAATVLLTPGLNRVVRRAVGMGPEWATTVNSVAAITPPLLEGILMRLWPWFYGGDPAVIEAGAIWLLWAIGVGLAFSVQTQVQAKA